MNPKKIARKVLPKKGIRVAEESYRKGRVYALQAKHGFPAKGLKVIAVTGTNGKTTTCCFINEVLKSGGYKTALFTTAIIELNGESRINTSHRTVPLTSELVQFIKKAKAAEVDYLILEVTSQALDQHKLVGIPVEVAVMTNLTQDHLDYHKTMQRYAEAKARLFSSYLKPKHVVLNRDDEWYAFFKKHSVGKVTSYGVDEDSSVRISDVLEGTQGSAWKLRRHGIDVGIKNSIPGLFNVYNATAAVCVAELLGMKPEEVQTGIRSLRSVAGRMELIDAGQSFTVIVDYAHAPDALERLLVVARKLAGAQKVRLVFGATGDRDRTKRPIMGTIAAKGADMIYLTDEESYSEDPATIRAAIREGIEVGKGTYLEVADRKQAIKQAFADAQRGDVVLLTGLGHQDTRNMGGKLIKWDEREVARKLLS